MSTTFDTLQFTETLQAAGIPEKHAKAEAKAIGDAFGQALDTQIATKADIYLLKEDIQAVKENIRTVKEDIQADISLLKENTQADIHRVERGLCELRAEQRLMKWMLGFNLILSFAMLSMMVSMLLSN